MPEEKKVDGVPVDANDSTDGESKDPNENNASVQKLLKERANWRTRALESEEKIKAAEEEGMIAREEFKNLAETRQKENDALKQELGSTKAIISTAKKKAALTSELNKLGVQKDYIAQAIRLGNLDDIKIDAEFDTPVGAEAVAQSIKQTVPVLFGESGRVDNGAPDAAGQSKLTLEEYKKLSPEDRIKRRGELESNLGIVTGQVRISSQ